jgi:hypothetical protein
MAQSGFTPIVTYHSTTASAAPLAADLAPGELALNINDMKLYCENSAGAVTLLASAAGATGTVSSVAVSGGTTGLTTSGGPITTTGTITLAGTLAVANGGTGVTTSTGTTNVVLSNSPTLVSPALGTPASGVVTNLTGTASININGTVGATTPATGAFTTVSATGAVSAQKILPTGAISAVELGIATSGASMVLNVVTGNNIISAVNGSIVTEASGTGLAVTGTLSATGTVTAATYAGAGTSLTGTANSLNAGIGVNQTWTSVTRAIGTTYTNSTGKPISVAITATCSSGSNQQLNNPPLK